MTHLYSVIPLIFCVVLSKRFRTAAALRPSDLNPRADVNGPYAGQTRRPARE
jgi:hypothetical protein